MLDRSENDSRVEIKEERDVMRVWTDVHDWIEQSLYHPMALISSRDVFHALLDGKMKLWSIYLGDMLSGAYVTELVSGSKGRGVNIIGMGGKGMTLWMSRFDDSVTKYAKAMGCKFIAEMGRPGWKRVLSPYGWTEGPSMMLKVL